MEMFESNDSKSVVLDFGRDLYLKINNEDRKTFESVFFKIGDHVGVDIKEWKSKLKEADSKAITKTFEISAPPEVMQRFENFLGFLHFNSGHSGLFAMSFDGDGSDTLKCNPEPKIAVKDGNKDKNDVAGFAIEIANEDGYQGMRHPDKHSSYSSPEKANESRQLKEHSTQTLTSIELITDDDSGIYSGDEFDFSEPQELRDFLANDPEAGKRLAKFMREYADQIEKRQTEKTLGDNEDDTASNYSESAKVAEGILKGLI